jgi:hypothetical protein
VSALALILAPAPAHGRRTPRPCPIFPASNPLNQEILHAPVKAGFIHPATHLASSSEAPSLPPMGLRLRLKESFDLSSYHGESLVILRALKRYGLIVADNGSSWYITGAPNPRWDDADLEQLKRVPGSAFEAVRSGSILRVGG